MSLDLNDWCKEKPEPEDEMELAEKNTSEILCNLPTEK